MNSDDRTWLIDPAEIVDPLDLLTKHEQNEMLASAVRSAQTAANLIAAALEHINTATASTMPLSPDAARKMSQLQTKAIRLQMALQFWRDLLIA